MKVAVHVARIGEMSNYTTFLSVNIKTPQETPKYL